MSSNIVEILRSSNEEVECLEKACALALHYKDDHPREAVISERIVKSIIERIQKKSIEILELYGDYDGARKTENDMLSGQHFVSEEHKHRIMQHTGQKV
jgi:splicing factor 3A subunit 3